MLVLFLECFKRVALHGVSGQGYERQEQGWHQCLEQDLLGIAGNLSQQLNEDRQLFHFLLQYSWLHPLMNGQRSRNIGSNQGIGM